MAKVSPGSDRYSTSPEATAVTDDDGALDYAVTWFSKTFNCLSDLTQDPRCKSKKELRVPGETTTCKEDSSCGGQSGPKSPWDDKTVPRSNKRNRQGSSSPCSDQDGSGVQHVGSGNPQSPSASEFGGMTFLSADSDVSSHKILPTVTPERGGT